MRVVVQRVINSSVEVDGKIVGKSDRGLMLLVGFTEGDSSKEIDWMVDKVINLRIFEDENDVMNKSLLDINGNILSISQFTLQAMTKDGNRPSYINAMKGEEAIKLYEKFNAMLNESVPTLPGVFGADMLINIHNDGPITIIIDSKER